ncbi:MAG TPA: PH domain-containing protein [Anaerolineales bacterium]
MADRYLNSLLGDNERIMLVTRQHWFLLVSAILLEVVLTIVVVAGVTIATATVGPLAAIGYVLLIYTVGRGLYDYLTWRAVQYVVTNRRVVHLKGVVNKEVTDTSLEKVNDVKMEQSFFGRLFDYGDLEILTASETGIDRFRRIGAPIRFKTAMLNAKEHMGQDEDRPGAGSGAGRGDIPELIAELDQLRKQGAISETEFETKKRELLGKM